MRGASLFLLLLLAGCGSEPEFKRYPPSTSRLPRSSDSEYFVRVNELGLGLLKAKGSGESFVVSPVGVANQLAVLLHGASGASRDELLALLALNESNLGDFGESQRALLNDLGDGGFVTSTAVFSVWPVKFDEGYVEKMGRTFGAVVKKLGGATIEGERLIHEWIEERVAHDYLAPQIGLNKQQQILALNCSAYYWNGPTGASFACFREERGDHEAFRFELGDGFTLVVMRPKAGVELAALVEGLDAESFGFVGEAVTAELPLVSLETESDLRPLLKGLGVGTVFGSQANLRAMSIETESGYRISEAVHKHSVDLRFAGGSATGPFVFAVVEDTTGAMVALGVVKA